MIGTLLGTVSEGIVEIKNCYIVPHNESSEQVCLDTMISMLLQLVSAPSVDALCFSQVAVDIAHHKTMFDLHQRVAPSETVVGWYAWQD